MNLRKKFSSGFTLIELLVVVAIIGILASVVLASLNTARAKGANASIKANLSNVRAQAEIVYDSLSPNGYGTASNIVTACTSGWAPTAGSLFVNSGLNAPIYNAIVAATNASGATGFCSSTTSACAVSVPLKVNEGLNYHWCVDSTGVSKGEAAAASSTACA